MRIEWLVFDRSKLIATQIAPSLLGENRTCRTKPESTGPSYCLWNTFDRAMCHNRSGLMPGVREVLGTPVAMPLADPKAAEQARFSW